MILFAKIIAAWIIINALIVAVRTLCAYRTPRRARASNRRVA